MRRMSPARRGPLDLVLYATGYAVLGAAAVLLAVVGLTGCTGSDPGAAAPTSLHPGTAATPTTSTPSGNPTDLAGAAAIAAVQKLYAELNRAIRFGSTTRYRATFTNKCTICMHDAKVTDSIYGKGQHVVGGVYRLASPVVVWNKPNLVIVQGVLSAGALTVQQGPRVVTRNPALKPSDFTWNVEPASGGWLVTQVEALM